MSDSLDLRMNSYWRVGMDWLALLLFLFWVILVVYGFLCMKAASSDLS